MEVIFLETALRLQLSLDGKVSVSAQMNYTFPMVRRAKMARHAALVLMMLSAFQSLLPQLWMSDEVLSEELSREGATYS